LTPSATTSGSLAFTGASGALTWLVVVGMAMMLIGVVGRLVVRRWA
jgi:hypothetical protein